MKTPRFRMPARPALLQRGRAGAAVLAAVLGAASPALRSHPNHPAPLLAALPTATPANAPQPATALPPTVATLSVTIQDATTGQPTAVRVRLTDTAGQPLGVPPSLGLNLGSEIRVAAPGTVLGLPPEAIGVMYGQNDTAQGYAFQPDGSFYVQGAFTLRMPAGKFHLTVSKGYEYIQLHDTLDFAAGAHVRRDYRLERWIDMPARGWYSADDHIHLRRSPRENPLILDWLAAEDLHVGVLLQMGDFWATYYSQYAFGRAGRYLADRRLLLSGQEDPRTGEIGHTISIGADQYVRFQNEYYSYDRVFDRVHQLGGISGYAHQAMSFHGHRGLTLDVLTGKIDFLELAQFCVPEGPIALEHYYRMLDLGYRVTALAGSDFPWCGRGRRPGEEQVGPRIGNARFYTQVGPAFTFESWFSAVKAGRTFVTTGPMLELQVNGQPPGTTLEVTRGTKLRLTAKAWGQRLQVPLKSLQLVGHGKVLAEARAGAAGQSADQLVLEHEITADHGIWLAARAEADVSQTSHTTPVYVTVGGDGFHNRARLAEQIGLARRSLQELRALLTPEAMASRPPGRSSNGPALYPLSRAHLQQRLAEAEAKLDALAQRP